jgi:hypothetical protein
MSPEERKLLASIELVPSSPLRLRKGQEKVEWETIKGKINRVEIGIPRCIKEEQPTKEGMITLDDLNEFSSKKYSFYRLNPNFTLLPDEGCRFQKADFIIDIKNGDEGRVPPLILSLRPQEIIQPIKVVKDKEVSATSGISDPILKIANIGVNEKHSMRTEFMNIMVSLQSFGARTKEGGWRFKLTESREIPLTSDNIEALVVVPQNKQTTIKFLIDAKIDVLTSLDRWLTWAFKSGPIKAELSFKFP